MYTFTYVYMCIDVHITYEYTYVHAHTKDTYPKLETECYKPRDTGGNRHMHIHTLRHRPELRH